MSTRQFNLVLPRKNVFCLVSSCRRRFQSPDRKAKQTGLVSIRFSPSFMIHPLPSHLLSQSVTSIPTFYQLICLTSLRHSLSHMTHHQTQIHKAYEPITISKTIGRTGEPPSHLRESRTFLTNVMRRSRGQAMRVVGPAPLKASVPWAMVHRPSGL